MSYGKSAERMNEFLLRNGSDEFKARTIDWICTDVGDRLLKEDMQWCREILHQHGFDPDDGSLLPATVLPISMTAPSVPAAESTFTAEQVLELIDRYNEKAPCEEGKIKPQSVYVQSVERAPQATVYFCIDEILTKHQNDKRNTKKGGKSSKTGKFVFTTVVYVLSREGVYRMVSKDIESGVRMALAYMLQNDLLANRNLVIYSDGAKKIKAEVDRVFGFRPFTYHLDYYHVCSRVYQELSRALYGGAENKAANHVLSGEIHTRIWAGNIDEAINYIKNIDKKRIKRQANLDAVVAYLEARKESMSCFALRSAMGLLNSSNRVECSNAQVCGRRQKRKSMSWSHRGSRALSAITAAYCNGEQDNLLSGRKLSHSPWQCANEPIIIRREAV